jgi:hypothetical protein
MPGNAAHEYELREATNQIADASRALLDTDARPVQRDQHPKQHGCVRARFVVDRNLDAPLRQGLFEQRKVYDAWIRFSNGGQRDDRKPDAHGMAVKLMGVEGPKVLATEPGATTQDFVMVDNPTFFLRDAAEYVDFSDVLLKARGKKPSTPYSVLGLLLGGPARSLATLALLSLSPGRFPTILRLIRFAGKRIASPLATRYWSTTPYKFGDTCMKFSAVPAEFPGGPAAYGPGDDSYDAVADFLGTAVAAQPPAAQPKGESPDYLREVLVRELAVRGAVFLFRVQLYQDESTTPIDDPTVRWPESAAPWHTVARIWVPKQVFDTPGRMAFGENLAFTPWHAIPAHEPLGEINLVRAKVYAQLSELRHRLNGITPREPNPADPDPTDSPPQWGADSSAFCHVLDAELELIRQRRAHVEGTPTEQGDSPGARAVADGGATPAFDVDSLTREARRRALHEHTTGLALAGTGPRGATFAVGFLQGLGSLALVRRFDYLSAVSGGGHAAAWLAAWLKREGEPENVERQLGPSRLEEARANRRYLATGEVVDEQPQPIVHLRSCARSFSPRAGILAADASIRVFAWARNVTIHLMVLLPLLVLVATAARLVVAGYALSIGSTQLDQQAAQFDSRLGAPVSVARIFVVVLLLLAGTLLLGWALIAIGASIRRLRAADIRTRRGSDPRDADARVGRRVVSALFAAALFFSFGLPPVARWIGGQLENLETGPNDGGLFSFRTAVDVALSYCTVLGWPNFLAHALLIGGFLAWRTARTSAGADAGRRKTFIGASFAGGATAGILVVLLEGLFHWFAQLGRLDLAASLIPPLAVLIVAAALVVETAALGRAASDAERAWQAGIGALVTKGASCWIAGMAAILYLPGVFFAAATAARVAGVLAWLACAAVGFWAGWSFLPRHEGDRAGWLKLLASLAASIFLIGLLAAAGLLVSLIANTPALTAPGGDDDGPFAYYLRGLAGTSTITLIGIAVVFGLLRALTRPIDLGLFSLCALDSERLTRCYLGASRPVAAWRERWSQPRDQRASVGAPSLSERGAEPVLPLRDPDPLTGLDPHDDLDLADVLIGRKGPDERTYWGPHLIFNTTAVAEQGTNPRRALNAEPFVLSPLFCGSQSLGFARTPGSRPARDAVTGLTLGRAAAICSATSEPSGSLLAPNALAALLAFLSARPGWWIEKPKPDGWTAASPRRGDLGVAESLGLACGHGDFVYLSGGGEFERLGVYELIRRRCRYIVAVDAGRAGAATDAGLANLIRRCRVDFGLRIDIDTRALNPAGPDRYSSAHFAVGKIHYGDVDPGGLNGVFVYVTTSMTGDEPADLQQWARTEFRLRHQPGDSADDFDDRQFEHYRCLGYHVARAVFGDAALRPGTHAVDATRELHGTYIERLFAAVNERWTVPERVEGEPASTPQRASADGIDHRS